MPDIAKGKIAVITGGATGIGFGMADALAARGMHIVLASRRPEKLESAAEKLSRHGGRILTVPCDVRFRDQVRALATRVDEAFGGTDLLIANAGYTTSGRLLDHDDAHWDEIIDTNFRGITHCVQAFYPAMAGRGSGTILLTASQTALPPDWIVNHGPYVACKAAVLALGLELRLEAASHGVNVSVLVPAGVESEMRLETVPAGSPMSMDVNKGLPYVDMMDMQTAQEAAERTLAGLNANDAIIATHGHMLPVVRDYGDRLVAAYEKAAAYRPGDG